MAKQTYEVGKNKPPKEHRWKKGQSGNPSGKSKTHPKPSVTPLAIDACFAKELAKPIAMTQDGKQVTVTIAEALAAKILRLMLMAEGGLEFKYYTDILTKIGAFSAYKETCAEAANDDETDDGLSFSEEERRMLLIAREALGDL